MGPPHPTTPEPYGCVWGGIRAWSGPFPAFRRLRFSLAPHRRPLHGEGRGGGHGGFCETGRSRGRCQAEPRRAPTRGRGDPGTDGGRPPRCSRERVGWLGEWGGEPSRREGQREGRCPRRCLSTFPARWSVSNGAAASGIAPGPPARLGSWAPRPNGARGRAASDPQCSSVPSGGAWGGEGEGEGRGEQPWGCHCVHCQSSAVYRVAPWGWSLLHLGSPIRAKGTWRGLI